MNTTFEVEPSASEDSSVSENKPSTLANPGKKPPKIPRQNSYSGRSVLKTLQTDTDIRSSDEFEKPKFLRKSVSAGMLRKKRSSSENKEKKSDGDGEVGEMLDSFSKKKRRLNDPKKSYFGSLD